MCGITGFIVDSKCSSYDNIHLLKKANEILRHRGPDDCGIWVDEASGMFVGHRRLAIQDLSSLGQQPMISDRYVIAFNGEIYNFIELRDLIRKIEPSRTWRGESDTEVLLAAINTWGVEESLKKIVGMFAFAVWDKELKELTLARDRMGEKPLYYGWLEGMFVFSSELKTLSVFPQFTREICSEALSFYLKLGYVPTPLSIYKGILKMPPGCYLKLPVKNNTNLFRDSNIGNPVKYWSIEDFGSINGMGEFYEQDAITHLENLIVQSVKDQSISDVPLGAFLSGGIDSSLITAIMQKHSTSPIKTFTIGFHAKEFNEAQHAKQISDYLGTEHTELYVSHDDARNVIPSLPDIFDEPFADSSQIPTFLVSRMTREHVTVSLSGDGGDELFGGYNRYALTQALWKKLSWLPSRGRHALAWGLRKTPVEFLNRSGKFLEASLSNYGRRGGIGQKLFKLSEVLACDTIDDLYLNLLSIWKRPNELLAWESNRKPPWMEHVTNCRTHLERLTRYDLSGYLPDDILVKVDRAAMSVSLETRVPLLDHRVVEFALGLPSDLKMRHGSSKWILRQVLYRYVPEEFFQRPKRGFSLPLGDWLRGQLKDWAEECLNERKLYEDGFFNPQPIRNKWKEHLGGQYDWQTPLWSILMFQCWLRKQSQQVDSWDQFLSKRFGSAI